MTLTDAQRRAKNKWQGTQKQWNVRLQPDLYDQLETLREELSLSRKELLESWLQQNK